MLNEDSLEIIKLRPHHIPTIRGYLDLVLSLEKIIKPENIHLTFEYHLKELEQVIRIYDGSAPHKCLEICDKLINFPNILIKIVEGKDDICASCIFDSGCSIGNYVAINEAYRGEGFNPNRNPIEYDQQCLKVERVHYNQYCSPKELFGEALRQP